MQAQANPIQNLQTRIGTIHPQQLRAWRQMKPYERLNIAFQAYQFALDTIRVREAKRADGLSKEELNWRVTRRMQGNPKLGIEIDGKRSV